MDTLLSFSNGVYDMPYGPQMGKKLRAGLGKRKKRVDPNVRQLPPYRDFEDGSLDPRPPRKKKKVK